MVSQPIVNFNHCVVNFNLVFIRGLQAIKSVNADYTNSFELNAFFFVNCSNINDQMVAFC